MKKILLGTALACLGLGTSSYAQGISQDFEGVTTPALPTGWTNATTGGATGWITKSGAYNWPLYSITPHTTYCLVDDANDWYNNPSYLTSPSFSMAGLSAPYLRYDWFFVKAYLNLVPPNTVVPYPHEHAWVELSTNGGSSWNFIDSVPGFTSSVTDWSTQFVNLSAYAGSTNCMLRFVYEDQGGDIGSTPSGIIGVAIDDIHVYDAAVTDIKLASVTPVATALNDYFMVGSGATFAGTIVNYKNAAVSYTAYYQVGSGAPVSQAIPSAAATSVSSFTISTPYTVTAVSQLPVKMWVKATGDADATNDSMNTAVIGYNFAPKKRMLFEEATGTWCGWCVRGIVYMDSLWKMDSNDVNIVSVHNADPMANMNTSTQKYDQLIGNYISGYPSMVIDRRYTDDPSGCFLDLAADGGVFAFAEMGLKYTTTGGKVKASVKVKPAMDLNNVNIELIITEDNVHKGGGSLGSNGWKQHNYYAPGGPGNSIPLHMTGMNFNTAPTDIDTPTIKYPFVARMTVPSNLVTSPNGVNGSLPSMTAGTIYNWTDSSVTINSAWDATKLRVIALIIDNDPNRATYGQVLNSISTKGLFLGVSDVKGGIESMLVYPNPASEVANVKFELIDATSVNISVVDMMGREVYTMPAQNMKAGEQQVTLPTSKLANGIYNVILRTENGVVSQRLSVTK